MMFFAYVRLNFALCFSLVFSIQWPNFAVHVAAIGRRIQMQMIHWLCGLGICALSMSAMAACDAQLKALQAEMNAKQVSLDVRRKVNTTIQPLIIPRNDLPPLSVPECQKRIQSARDLIQQPAVTVAAK
jgi:hypothetical protein